MFNQYILILLWIGLMGLLVGNFYRIEYNSLTGEEEWRVKPFFAFVVMVPIIWMATNRGWFGDSGVYIRSFWVMPTSFSGIGDYLQGVTKDKGFALISCLIKAVIGGDYAKYFFVVALIQALAVLGFYRKYTKTYIFAIFLFVASTDYISWMFNGIRQFMAVVIILLGTQSMLNKNFAKLIVVVLIASTMHLSALIVLPIVFVAQGEVWNKKTLLFMIGTVFAVAFVSRFTSLMDNALANTQYANMVSDYTAWQDNGTNPIRVLVYSIPALLSFWGRNQIKEVNNPVINLSVNMSIISMGLYLVSMVTSGIFLGRLPIYTSLFSYILLPWEIENLFGDSNKSTVKVATIVGYLAYYFYAMHFQNALI